MTDVFGTTGDETIDFSFSTPTTAGDDRIWALQGNDFIKGGGGADQIDGGFGADTATYEVDGTTEGVIANLTTGSGGSFFLSSFGGTSIGDKYTSIENLTGSEFGDTLIGDFGANILEGGTDFLITISGDDFLFGGGGNDTLDGQFDNDTLNGGSGADEMHGGGGIDTLSYLNFSGVTGLFFLINLGPAADLPATTGVTITLDASGNGSGIGGDAQGDTFTSIENVIGSRFADVLTGNASVNELSGDLGDDTLNGGGGGDTLDGGDGNDTYIVDNVGVTLTEFDGQGTDTVQTSLTFSIQALAFFENITLTGAALANATGNETANVINGNSAINIINGRSGSDTINGNGGNDNLQGSAGNDKLNGGKGFDTLNGSNGFDTLTGGLGRDTMAGGLHRDIFDFNAAAESGKVAFTRDIITDFQKGVDDIDLSTIDAKSGVAGNQAFIFTGTAPLVHLKGQLHIKFSGANTIVEGDIDGNGAADISIQVNGHKVLTAGDFIL